jgi:hypothetical protein
MTFLLTSMHLDGNKILLIFGKLRNCNLWDEAGKGRFSKTWFYEPNWLSALAHRYTE